MYTIDYILNNLSNIKNSYDCFDYIGFYTNGFTEGMDEIEIIDFNHNFFTYLDALIELEKIKDKIYHCYYHKDTKSMKMIVKSNIKGGIVNVIHNAWEHYWKENCDVKIYNTYCNELYIFDNYENNKKEYNKNIINRYIEMI